MTYILLLLLLTLSPTTSSPAQCLTSQSSALLHLKQSFSFTVFTFSNLSSWLPTTDCCHWEGVLCANPASGMVTSLNLSNFLIYGNLSPSLFNLTALTSLNLAFNIFDQIPIPDSFHLLPKLTTLNLSNAGFIGQIPASIGTLTHLISLDLSTFYLNEGQESSLKLNDPDLRTLIKNLRSLRELYLNGVNISANGTEWGGVVSASAPELQELSLLGCSISGPIDSSLTGLLSLRLLLLDHNELNCAVPDFIGNLTCLSELSLNSCGLKGELPETISKLRNLAKLDLQNNSLTGPIAPSLFSLPLLQVLQLSQNRLSGLLQEFVNPSPRLQILDLSSNNFTGTIDLSVFASLGNLSSLDLSNNRLSVQDEATTDDSSLSFPTMSTLNLAGCNLTNIPYLLRNQTRMGSLDLSNNRISGIIPSWIWGIGFSSLMYFNLSCNLFTNVERPLPELSIIHSISVIDLHFNKLQGPIPLPPAYTTVLDYSNNSFTSIIPSNISLYLVNTIYFSLSNNNLTGAIPPFICNAGNLEVLDLGFNMLTGPIPRCLMGNTTFLTVLNLRHNQLTGPIPNTYTNPLGCLLQTLNVNDNQLSGKLPSTLTNCSTLEVLDLGNNRFQDSFPFWLSNLPLLKVLVLGSNKLYGRVGSPNFPMLQVFDLSSNNFNGILSPECFSSFKSMMCSSSSTVSRPDLGFSYLGSKFYQALTVIFKNQEMTLVKSLTLFTYIDLSDNKFEGEIPQVIGELTELYMLNMSHNFFTGRIPVSIGGLVELESLDLRSNQLSGEIPQELVDLTFLSVLNLSDNKLVGRIPQGGQLQTFDDAFEGNGGLCGAPLVKVCSNVASPNESTDEVVSEPSWELVVVVVSGFVTGLAVVFGGLMYWEKGRTVFEEKVDGMTWALSYSVGRRMKGWKASSVSESARHPVRTGDRLGLSNLTRRQRN